MSVVKKLSLLFSALVLFSCTDEKKLDTAFSLGAHTTVNLFLEECASRYENLPVLEIKERVETGLTETRNYFISIDDTKWIEEASEIASTSLNKSVARMTKEKCTNMIAAIAVDGGVKKSIRDYYPD